MFELIHLADGSVSVRRNGKELGIVAPGQVDQAKGYCFECGEAVKVEATVDAHAWAEEMERILNQAERQTRQTSQ